MATEQARLLLERLEAAPKDATAVQDAGEAEPPSAVMVPYLTDCRKKLRVRQQQLSVLDGMLQLLESAQPPHLLDESPAPHSGGDTHARLRALKGEYAEGVERVEGLIAALLDRMEQTAHKKEQLQQLLCVVERKKVEVEQQRMKRKNDLKEEKLNRLKLQKVEESLLANQEAVLACKQHLSELEAQRDAHLASVDSWTLLQEGLQQTVQARLGLTCYRLVWAGLQEVRVELVPPAHRPDLSNLRPLPLTLTCAPDGRFSIQSQEASEILDGPLHGSLTELSSALQEVCHRYLGQGQLLAEIQEMHSRFAIDWRPAERLLVFLKSASVVCHLSVGEGYPSQGRATLVSIRGEKGFLDIAALQPPQVNPSLSEWLEFLSSCPDF